MLLGPVNGRCIRLWIYLCLVVWCDVATGHQYEDDLSPSIYSLRPRGVRVTVRGHPGLTAISFNANINIPIQKWQQGDVVLDLHFDGREWTAENQHIVLEEGDVVYYWMHVNIEGKGELIEGRSYIPHSTNPDNTGSDIRLAVRQKAPSSVVIDPSVQISDSKEKQVSESVLGTLIDSFLSHRYPGESLQTSSSSKPQPFYTTGQIIQTPNSQYIESSQPFINPPQNGFTASQTTFITPSQTGFTNPSQTGFISPSPTGFINPAQAGYINPSQTGFTNPSQNGFNTQTPSVLQIPVIIQPATTKPPSPVYVQQSPTLSNTPVPVPNYQTQRQPDTVYPKCEESETTVNGRPTCKEQQIFIDTFNYYNSTVWSYDMEFSSLPDGEFCVFTGLQDNSRTGDGTLKIWPTLTDDKYGKNFVFSGRLDLPDCTAVEADHCTQEGEYAYILPPTMSARYSTRGKWSFKYGKIDIVAKLARGDWLYPEFWLVPPEKDTRTDFPKRLEMAVVRGNTRLTNKRGEEIGASVLEAGAAAPTATNKGVVRKEYKLREPNNRLWTDDFHTFSLLWTKDAIAFSVDGIEIGVMGPKGQVSSSTFHEEMSLVVGLGVGGVRVFPDTKEKPWTNTEPKAMYKFWGAKDQWYRSWSRDANTLTIKEVRITSL